MSPSLVLTGMPGSGKSTVGRLAAERRGRAFVDIDALIERRTGRAPAEILRRDGEPAFRRHEREAVLSLAGATDIVVATGGGTVTDPESRAALQALGTIVCLDAPPHLLASRLGTGAADRPLLDGPTDHLERRLSELLQQRRPAYDALPWHVETAGRTPGAVAEECWALADAVAGLGVTATAVATPAGGYGVLLGAGLLDALGPILRARAPAERALVVSDGHVSPLYAARVAATLDRAGIHAARATIPAGEAAKTLETVRDLYRALVLADLDRHGLVLALGGGVVGDTAGFAAATYLRGVAVAQVPTSLLAMVDAAIGGKTGVNLPAGKNLVGAFHHPVLVAADPTALATLPPAHLRGGMSEIVKAALLGGEGPFARLEATGMPDARDVAAWTETIASAVAVKAAIVSRDPHEATERVLLNLGHTFAHAIEQASGLAVAHGEAVAMGLAAACRLSERLGLAAPDLTPRVERLLRALELPTRCRGLHAPAVLSAMAPDKKRRAGRLRFVLPRAVGSVEVVDDVPAAEVAAVLEALCTMADARGP